MFDYVILVTTRYGFQLKRYKNGRICGISDVYTDIRACIADGKELAERHGVSLDRSELPKRLPAQIKRLLADEPADNNPPDRSIARSETHPNLSQNMPLLRFSI